MYDRKLCAIHEETFFLNYRSFFFQFSNKYKQKIYIVQAVPFTSFWSLYWGPEPSLEFNITMTTDKY
jgi:hypothetical protein